MLIIGREKRFKDVDRQGLHHTWGEQYNSMSVLAIYNFTRPAFGQGDYYGTELYCMVFD